MPTSMRLSLFRLPILSMICTHLKSAIQSFMSKSIKADKRRRALLLQIIDASIYIDKQTMNETTYIFNVVCLLVSETFNNQDLCF